MSGQGVWSERDGVVAVYKPVCDDPNDPNYWRELESAIKQNFPSAVFVECLTLKKFEYQCCGSDESLHFKVGDVVFHVCYSEPEEVTIQPEVKCPQCGCWLPISLLATHLVEYCSEYCD
jgi:hypothetical protein